MNIFKTTYQLSIALIIALCASINAHALSADSYATESVLAKGNWVKVKVSGTGFQSITPAEIKDWGFGNSNKVKVFGYGGAPISLTLDEKQIDDLVQVPVINHNGYIHFYAQGVTTWGADNMLDYIQYQHPYATEAYYFVTDRDDIEQLTMSEVDATPREARNVITTYTAINIHEKELVSPIESGNLLLGEDFRFTSSREFEINLPGYVDNTPVKILTAFAAKSSGLSKLSFAANGEALEYSPNDDIAPIASSGSTLLNIAKTVKTVALVNDDLRFKINFASTGTLTLANLDYITVNYTAKILPTNFHTDRNASCDDVISINDGTVDDKMIVCDVTTPHAPVIMKGVLNGNDYRFSPIVNGHRRYAVKNTAWVSPTVTLVERINNQSIHSEPTPDMIIITPTQFKQQAQRIADLHLMLDSMRVLVVEQDKVFNEFSSGTPDFMAYRKMAKMFYDRGADESGHRLGYILLFGRGTYDNRKLSSTVKALKYPMLLTWQTDNGSSEIDSYSTDDILGFLEDGSGKSLHTETLSIAVGRMPVKSVTEAKNVVDKLYAYTTKQDFGAWKNNVMVIADDMNNAVHMEQADAVIEGHKANGGESYVYNRIYLDAFELENSGAGRAFPQARKKMYQLLNEGVLYLNYIGHSGNYAWTADGLLTFNDINSMYLKHYPLMLTASCEFTRLDKAEETGGETLFLNPRGGAIALITTARQVYITDNGTLNKHIANFMFAKDKDGKHYRIGDILRLGKNALPSNSNKLKYFLVGDPALRLAYPTYDIKVESINGNALNAENMPVFKARQSMTVKGSIVDANGNKATEFNGSVIPTLYDIEKEITTHGYSAGSDEGKVYTFLDRSNKLSVSKDSVRNGEFTVTVAIPSEIEAPSKYDNYTPAMLNLYASSDNGIEANGNNEQFYIYGYDDLANTDSIGPNIEVFTLNSEAFTDGDNINESPLVIAHISDENGINLSSSGIGHQMTLLLDGKTTYSDISTYYTPDFTSVGNKGSIYYALNDLSEGNHTLRLKVWDTFNNSSEKTLSFNVVKGMQPGMHDVYAVGNPASVDAKFYIKHNRPDALITITLYVYDLMGRLVWSTQESGKSDMFTSFPITWNLTDQSGRRVPRGIYVYKAGISTDGVHETTKAKKIAVAAE